jgi:hypothetical protein
VSESTEPEEKPSPNALTTPQNSGWRPVDKQLWAKKETPTGVRGIVAQQLRRFAGVFSSPFFLLFVATPLGGLGAYLTFFLAYWFGGTQLFGFYFVGIWATIVVGGVAVLQKSGYARNFEQWDFPVRRVVFLPVSFLLVIGIFLLIFYLGGRLR